MSVSLITVIVFAMCVWRAMHWLNIIAHYKRPLLPAPHLSCKRAADQSAQFIYIRKLEKQL